ncbi:MAG: hypothetical protein V4594_00560 [Bacteroidota bacterium]
MQNEIAAILTSIATFLLYKFFSKIIPVSSSWYTTDKSLALLKIKYRVFEIKYISLTFLSTAALAFFFFQLFQLITDSRTEGIDDARILIKPDMAILLLPAVFDGLLVSAILAPIFGERHLQNDWNEYMAYNNLKYKFNYQKGMTYILRFVGILVIPMTIFALDMYSSFGEHSIKLNPFLGIGVKTYNYSAISSLSRVMKVKAPNGDILNEPHVVIKFKDGAEWSTRSDGFDDEQKNQEIIDLVASKTKKQITTQEFAE